MATDTADEYAEVLQEMESRDVNEALSTDEVDGFDLVRDGTEEPGLRARSTRPRDDNTSDEEGQLDGSSPLSRLKRARMDHQTPHSAKDGNLTQFIPHLISGRNLTKSSLAELNFFAKVSIRA